MNARPSAPHRLVVAGLAALGLALAATAAPSPKSQTSSKRPLKVSQWMNGVVKFHYTGLRRSEDNKPADGRAWARLKMNAAILNETGHVLVADGRTRDKIWEDAAKILRDGSVDALAAIDKKDHAAMNAAVKSMGQACVACHKKHRPDD